jgi:hypothetical protein
MISTLVAIKFLAIFGGALWYSTRTSRRLKAEIAQARAAEAAAGQARADLSA